MMHAIQKDADVLPTIQMIDDSDFQQTFPLVIPNITIDDAVAWSLKITLQPPHVMLL